MSEVVANVHIGIVIISMVLIVFILNGPYRVISYLYIAIIIGSIFGGGGEASTVYVCHARHDRSFDLCMYRMYNNI